MTNVGCPNPCRLNEDDFPLLLSLLARLDVGSRKGEGEVLDFETFFSRINIAITDSLVSTSSYYTCKSFL